MYIAEQQRMIHYKGIIIHLHIKNRYFNMFWEYEFSRDNIEYGRETKRNVAFVKYANIFDINDHFLPVASFNN